MVELLIKDLYAKTQRGIIYSIKGKWNLVYHRQPKENWSQVDPRAGPGAETGVKNLIDLKNDLQT